MGQEVVMVFSAEQAHSSVPELRSEVWSHLPQSLVERVLMRLGTTDEARLSTVCKEWRSLFFSAWFRAERAALGLSSYNPMFILNCFDHNRAIAEPRSLMASYDQDHLHQVRVDLGFLPIKYREVTNGGGPKNLCGFIIFHGIDGSSCISNLGNKTWRVLPNNTHKWSMDLSGVHVRVSNDHDVSTIHFWAMLWDFTVDKPYLVECSSNNWVWTKVVTLEWNITEPNLVDSFVICKGVLYVIPCMYNKDFLDCYDVATGVHLGRKDLPQGCGFDTGQELSVVGDRVFYTARNLLDCIDIYELENSGKSWLANWRRVSALPMDLLQIRQVGKVSCMDVQVVDGTFYIALYDLHVWYLFAYCIAQDSWRFVLSQPISCPTDIKQILIGELRPRFCL